MARDEIENIKEVIEQAQKRRQKSSHCNAYGLMPSEELGVGAKVQKIQGRVVLQGDVVKNDAGSYAVFAEQGHLRLN